MLKTETRKVKAKENGAVKVLRAKLTQPARISRPKMEGFLNLIRLFFRWVFPYISLTYNTAYIGDWPSSTNVSAQQVDSVAQKNHGFRSNTDFHPDSPLIKYHQPSTLGLQKGLRLRLFDFGPKWECPGMSDHERIQIPGKT